MNEREKLAVLKRARELVARPYGWAKGAFEHVTYRPRTNELVVGYCIGAACQVAARELFPQMQMFDGIHSTRIAEEISLLEAAKAKGHVGVAHFNDAPETKKRDVLELFDEKIAEMETTQGEKEK